MKRYTGTLNTKRGRTPKRCVQDRKNGRKSARRMNKAEINAGMEAR